MRPDREAETRPIARPPGWTGTVARTATKRAEKPGDGAGGPAAARAHGQTRAHGHRAPATSTRRGSSWRELPVLAVVALVLTALISTFVGRPYEIPSGSMERTLHGCSGCTDDRVAVDKITYRFADPAPGDVVVFRGPPAWTDDDDSLRGERSGNVVVRTLQDGLSTIGLAAPDETDFVKRVIAVGGQTVGCCDARHRVVVDGHPLDEPYLYFQPGHGPPRQESFAPVRLAPGQLWVMGDNRNNSADARYHGPIGVGDVIGEARVVLLPVSRWRTVPSIDPQKLTR